MMPDSYEILKTLHVLGAVLFLGNIIVTAVWKSLADRTRNPVVMGYSQRLVSITDIAFTLTGVVLLAVTGPAMAARIEGFDSAWVIWGGTMFAVTGLIWLVVLIPVQALQARLARNFTQDDVIPARYWQLARLWQTGGSIAVVLPLVTMALMVMKPA